jgi:D-threo-aldose 1-dehydrogenase
VTPSAPRVADRSTLGRSDVAVTTLGFGAAALGNLYAPMDDDLAAATVDAAWQAGIRYFDTAPHYGLGLSERRLGAALRDRPRESFVVSTKVGRLLEPVPSPSGDDLAHGFAVPATHRRRWDFSAPGVRRSLEESLERLGLDRVDVALIHDPDDHPEQALREAYPALRALRDEGVLGAVGVGMNQSALPARFVTEADLDVVLLAGRYTLLEQPALDDLLPRCVERGVAVIAAGVFNSGLLARPRPTTDATYDYAAAPGDVVARANRIADVCERHGTTLPQAALQLPLAHPAVRCVLVGARTSEELAADAALLQAPIPVELWDELLAEGLLDPRTPTPGRGHGAASPRDRLG